MARQDRGKKRPSDKTIRSVTQLAGLEGWAVVDSLPAKIESWLASNPISPDSLQIAPHRQRRNPRATDSHEHD